MAFPTGWGYKQAITIQSSKIDSALSDFPFFVFRDHLDDDVVDPSGSNNSQANGGDVRFSSDSAGTTQLACDVMSWEHDSSTGAGDADIRVRVNVPTVSSSADTTIYIWYNTAGSDSQPAVGTTYGQYNAYPSACEGYWTLDDLADRTSNQYTLTAQNTPTSGSTGKVGTCYTFDGGSDRRLENTSVTDPGDYPLSIMCWAKGTVSTGDHVAMQIGDPAGGDENLYVRSDAGGAVYVELRNDDSADLETDIISGAMSDDTWSHIGARASSSELEAYHNGAGSGSATSHTATFPTISQVTFGCWDVDVWIWEWDGEIDEGMFYTADLADAWFKAEYEQTNSPSTFATAGTPTAAGGGATVVAGPLVNNKPLKSLVGGGLVQ